MATGKSSGRRRIEAGSIRRSYDSRVSSGRRFGRYRDSDRHEDVLPRTATNVPRKKQVLASRIRAFALCSFLLVLFAVVTSRQKRRARRMMAMRQGLMRHDSEHSLDSEFSSNPPGSHPHLTTAPAIDSKHDGNSSDRESHPQELESQTNTGGPSSPKNRESDAGVSMKQHSEEASSESPTLELLDQIESFSRTDMVSGARPVCRISNACILANGLVSLPMWMSKEDRLLRRCGVGPHTYHIGTGGPKHSQVKKIDADLAQLVRLMRFKEPSATMVDFFTESILHAAFLFDTFAGVAPTKGTQSHCISNANTTECDQQLIDNGSSAKSVAAGIKPAVFVPKKIYDQDGTWESHALNMLGGKYGSEPLTKVLTEDVIDPAEKGKTNNVSATCFRSILFSDTKFKDLPSEGFEASSKFFKGNGIDISSRPSVTSEGGEGSQCSISIGLLRKNGARTLKPIEELKQKISTIAGAALPSAQVNIEVLSTTKDVPFTEQIAQAQKLDIVVGGTSNSLSNMAFMKTGGSVFEVFPFAWQPPNFEELSRVMGHRYHPVLANPQTTEFKTCIEHELFQLRKQNRLQGDESPPWVKQVEDKWEAASGEFALSGKSPLLLNSDTTGVSNFHTRSCARHQTLEFNIDDVAKAILLDARKICHPT